MGLFGKKEDVTVTKVEEQYGVENDSSYAELFGTTGIEDDSLKDQEEEDRIFFEALDYMTSPERNYLSNIQRGTMSKDSLFKVMRTHFEDLDLDQAVIDRVLSKLEKYIWGYYIIEDLINDDSISDIKIYNENNVRIKKFGKRFPGNVKFHDEKDYRRFVDIICSRNKISLSDIDAIQTFTDAESNENARLRFNLTSPIVNSGHKPLVHIRKVPKHKKSLIDLATTLKDLEGNPSPMFPEELVPFLQWMAQESPGILFTGKGASGKTTLMNAMLESIPEDMSGCVIQENDELFSDHPDMMFQHVLQSRGESKIQYTLKDLAINGLLTDLDYFIIGEIKGGEAAYFMNAAYTGHKCWASVHGVNSIEAMNKLADYVKYETDYPREDILRMLRYMRFVIFLRGYKIEEISEVVGYDPELRDLKYRPVYKRGEFFKDPRKMDQN